LRQPKNWTAFSASSKPFVPAQKTILLNENHFIVWHKMFVTAKICKFIFGLAKKIWTSTNIFCVLPKIYSHIVQVTNILCQTRRWFAFSEIVFLAGTKVFEEALNAVKFWDWLKKFGPAQNIL